MRDGHALNRNGAIENWLSPATEAKGAKGKAVCASGHWRLSSGLLTGAAILILRSAAVSQTSRSAWDRTETVEIREMLRLVEDDTAALQFKMRIAVTGVTSLVFLAHFASFAGDSALPAAWSGLNATAKKLHLP